MSQIAEAAEISESTFFRCFPSKEDVVLWDEFDPLIARAFRAQPAGYGPIRALRAAMREVLTGLSAEEREEACQRMMLAASIPLVRAAGADQIGAPTRLLTRLVAERTRAAPGRPSVRTVVGAVMGVCLSAMLEAIEDPRLDVVSVLDEALERLEAGLPL